MSASLEQVTSSAMDLTACDKFALAERLLASAEAPPEPGVDAAWDAEIRDRIRAIDEGEVVGISREDVMREAEKRLGL